MQNATDIILSQNHQIPQAATPKWRELLHRRGLSNAAITRAQIEPDANERGWCYPIAPNVTATRYKAFPGQRGAKYRYKPKKPDYAGFYDPAGDLADQIAAANGVLILASGEPDVWACYTAGIYNVTCTLHGEGSIPPWLVDELRHLQVRAVNLWPDRDQAGLNHAQKVHNVIPAEITTTAYALPYALGSKADLNTLLRDVGVDQLADALAACDQLELPDPPTPVLHHWSKTNYAAESNDSAELADLYQHWCETVERAAITTWVIPAPNSDGWSRRNFSSPLRDDRNPSARWSFALHGFKDFATGEFYNTHQVADLLGVQSWADYKTEHAPQTKKKRRRKSERIEDTIKPVTLPTLDAHQRVNLAYISDLNPANILGQRVTCIKSPLGTGKTELVKRLIDALGPDASVLVITHRNALIANTAERLNLETHQTIPDNRIQQAHRLAITPNSLHKANTSRHWDLVIIDEIEQVLPHLQGGTLRGGEAYRAHHAINQVLSHARRVVAADAHMTNISAQWLHQRCGSAPYIIVNDHQPDRGQLTLYQHESKLLDAAHHAIEQQRGVVVMPVASEKRAQVIYRWLTDRFGSTGGLLVTGKNSSSREIQNFIKHINDPEKGIQSLRFLVCTSSFGTGLNVTAPVYAVFGVFHNQPLLASDMLQMIMRYRNATHRAAYVQHLHADQPRDYLEIAGDLIDAAAETRIAADFAHHRVENISAGQHLINQLDAKLQVAAGIQKTDLVSYFAAFTRAEGFTLAYQNAASQMVRQLIRDTQDRIAEETAQRVLAATPVSADQYEQHQLAGTITQAVIDGYERWKIETTVHLTLNRQLYDELYSSRARSAVRRLADILDHPENLKARDRLEAADNVLLSQRGHYTTRRALVVDGISLVYGTDFVTSTREVSEDDLETCGFVAWVNNHLTQIQRLVDRRDDLSRNPLFVLRRLLAAIGLKLDRRRVMVAGHRYWLYVLDAEHRDRWLGYARARLAGMAAQNTFATNTEEHVSFRESGKGLKHQFEPPPLDGDLLDDIGAMYTGRRKKPKTAA